MIRTLNKINLVKLLCNINTDYDYDYDYVRILI